MTRALPPLFLTSSRLVLGPLYAHALLALGGAVAAPGAGSAVPAGWGFAGNALPLAIAVAASATDFADGRLARRLRAESAAGAALDVAADAAFLLCALPALALAGLVSWSLPIAAAAALAALAVRWRRGGIGPAAGGRSLPDAAGHLAGIVNYGAVLVASGVPLGVVAPGWLRPASVLVALLNLAPIALRWRAG